MASLTIRNLDKFYGPLQVLHGIELDVKPGEFIVLVGPSGCGKSTLLSMIAGLETISQGEIAIDGRVVNHVPPKDRDIAMVFQSYALYPTMTVRQNITFGMESRNVPKAEQKEAVKRVSELLQISELLHRKPHQLSGGQRQRVAMGRALVRDPLLFLFDEPLSNLDAKLRVEMRTEIKKLYKAVGKTTVYVTHDQIEAMTLASRIAVMRQGYVQQFATPREVYEEPANMFVASFMGSPAMNFSPASIVSHDGAAHIAVPVGDEVVRLPKPMPHLEPGREIVLGVRPEHLSVHAIGDENGEGTGDQGRLPAVVDVVEPTGAETIVIARVAGTEVTIRVDPDSAPAEGEHVALGIELAKACLFDPQTEKLLPAANAPR